MVRTGLYSTLERKIKDIMNQEAELPVVEVEWVGKKILLRKDKLDEWHAIATDEQRVDYINGNHEYRHTGDPIGVYRISKTNESRTLQEPDDLVLVHWSGVKVMTQTISFGLVFLYSSSS
jgi:hypothetical protein